MRNKENPKAGWEGKGGTTGKLGEYDQNMFYKNFKELLKN